MHRILARWLAPFVVPFLVLTSTSFSIAHTATHAQPRSTVFPTPVSTSPLSATAPVTTATPTSAQVTIQSASNATSGNIITVTTADQLAAALAAALPGDTIQVADGTYARDGGFTLTGKSGTATQPIVVRALNRGGAVIAGAGYVVVSNSTYIVLDGFAFTGTGNAAVLLNGSQHSTITRNRFQLQDDLTQSANWVRITGANSGNNSVTYNDFGPKQSLGNFVAVEGTDTQVSQYDTIAWNYFHDLSPHAENGREAVRIGSSGRSLSEGFATIEYNRFENCDGDAEIISIKSGKNIVRYNTIIASYGTISLRHGNGSAVYGNFILGTGKKGTGGIRAYGEDHLIYNNYIQELRNDDPQYAPIAILNGDASDAAPGKDLTLHYTPEHIQIMHNTIVNNLSGIVLGYAVNNQSLPPQDITIANNIVERLNGPAVTVYTQPVDLNWSGNIMYPDAGIGLAASQIRVIDPLLAASGLLHVRANSPAIDAAQSSFPQVSDDMDGQARQGVPDVGADEYATSARTRAPLTLADVGPQATVVDTNDPDPSPITPTATADPNTNGEPTSVAEPGTTTVNNRTRLMLPIVRQRK